MVQVSIHIRPTSGYHHPNKVDHLLLDSADRLETIQEKYSTAGSSTTRLYCGDHELPLNSSIGSHNFDDGTILECCRSPALSAALSSCLKDFEKIKKLPEKDRNMEHLKDILQTPAYILHDPDHETWTNWSNDRLKTRIINLATIKAVLQRQHRYHVHDLPKCDNCQSLFDALEKHNVWAGGGNGNSNRHTVEATSGRRRFVFHQQAHIFKPHKKDGNPSTNWILVEEKLRIQAKIRREFSMQSRHFTHGYDSPPVDWLEEFVRQDHARHSMEQNNTSTWNDDTADPYLVHLENNLASPQRPHESTPSRAIGSSTRSNRNSISQSVLGATSSSTPTTTPRRVAPYIPLYLSGPFAVLAALHLAMHSKHPHSNGRRLLTLTEDQLKRMAQPLCRSNLYDKARIRGRSAFACVDSLIEKQFVRKEIVRNNVGGGDSGGEIEKWGLLPNAEALAQKCADFDRALNHVIPPRDINDVSNTAHRLKSNLNIVLCLDTREDVHLLERIKACCEDERIPFVTEELPAGDYLFLDQTNPSQEYVLPIIVERKSWSDLADSCLGKGLAQNRLDCVKLGGDKSGCASRNCQLCKLKRCGCKRVMFIIEGERCLGRDSVHMTAKKCTKENCCSACKLLSERHNVTQDILEGVLHRLQMEHGCFILYSRNYNETISSLFDIRTILLQTEAIPRLEPLPFESYLSNSRRKSSASFQPDKPTRVQDLNIETIVEFIGSQKWDLDLIRTLCSEIPNEPQRSKQSDDSIIELYDSEDDNFNCFDLNRPTKKRCNQANKESINLNSDSDSVSDCDIQEVVTQIRGGDTCNLSSDDEFDNFSCKIVAARDGFANNNNQTINIDSDSESDEDPFLNLSRFNKDERNNSYAKPSESDDPSSDGTIFLEQYGKRNGSQLPTLGENFKALCTAKKLVYDTDDDFPSNQKKSTLSSATFTSQTPSSTSIRKRKANDVIIEESSVQLHRTQLVHPLLILHGWDDYERRFHQRIDKMWKDFYLSASSHEHINDFCSESIHRLQPQIQQSDFVFVQRRTLMRFSLWLQLAFDVQIRSVQRQRFADEIKLYFSQTMNSSHVMQASATTISTPQSIPVALSTQHAHCRDQVCQRSMIPRNLGPHSTPTTSSNRQTVDMNRCFEITATSLGKRCASSSTRDMDSIREARLKRFDKHSTIIQVPNPTTWSCPRCTLENNNGGVCEACGTDAPAWLPTLAEEKWTCSQCTLQNAIDNIVCIACDTLKSTSTHHPDRKELDIVASSRKEPLTAMSSSSKATNKRVARCGACGQEDHTRANATEVNCPAFFDDKEVDRREKNRLKRAQSLASEQAKIKEIETEAAKAEKINVELARIQEEMKRNNERAEAFRKDELKRRKQKVQRLQKRQNGV